MSTYLHVEVRIKPKLLDDWQKDLRNLAKPIMVVQLSIEPNRNIACSL